MGKAAHYEECLKAAEEMFDKELSSEVNQLNVLAVLKEKLALFWVGLYRAKPDQLVLGPYAGTLPCTKIQYGSGLCGQTANTGELHCVNDVSQIENYIACHPDTQAEIVVPGYKNGTLAFVLDIDSTAINAFDDTDKQYLPRIAEHLANIDHQP